VSQSSSGRRYRGLTPEQLRAERRERLLSAALDLFATRGYANSPIETICSTARVATRHFYEQFDGREALLQALLGEIIDEISRRVGRVLENDTVVLDKRVDNGIAETVSYLLDDPRRARVVCIECVGVSQAMEQYRREVIHEFASLIKQYAEVLADIGVMPQRDYTLPSVAAVGMLLELLEEWLTTEHDLTPQDMVREIILIFRVLILGTVRYEEAYGGG